MTAFELPSLIMTYAKLLMEKLLEWVKFSLISETKNEICVFVTWFLNHPIEEIITDRWPCA